MDLPPEEFEWIKMCVRKWRRIYPKEEDGEFYSIAWEKLEEARKRFDGRGRWESFAKQRIIFGLMTEHRKIQNKRKIVMVALGARDIEAQRKTTPLEVIEEYARLQIPLKGKTNGRKTM